MYVYAKIRNFKQITTIAPVVLILILVVYVYAKIRNFKQITTQQDMEVYDTLLCMSMQRYEILSKSQHYR